MTLDTLGLSDISEEDRCNQHFLSSFILSCNSEEYRNQYDSLRQDLRDRFRKYRSSPPQDRATLDSMIGSHAAFCLLQNDATARRRHNSFVLMYITDRNYSISQIAKIQGTTSRNVSRDLNHVLDDLMILAFGIDGLPPQQKINT